MIYTSNFSGKKIGTAIGIARYAPKNFIGPSYKRLAPYQWMLKESVSEDEYKKAFKKILAELNPHQVVEDLYKYAPGKDITLLCYEKPGEFCHRHMVAEWLVEAGYEVEEVADFCCNKKASIDTNQLNLF